MIEHKDQQLSVRKKCELLGVTRSRMYYRGKKDNSDDVDIMKEIRETYEKTPFYGYRRIHAVLKRKGYRINRKKVQRLMKAAGVQAIYPKPKTTKKNVQHKIYPYLLKDVVIDRPNVAWEADITYIRIKHGFVYLFGIIDVFSRKIMGWQLSPFLDTQPCLEALEFGLQQGKPIILNTDQGSQFTSNAWISKVKSVDIQVSMDGKGRWADNVHIERFWRSLKYESVFLQQFENVAQAKKAIDQYINFYNQERPHQSLTYKTPNEVYCAYETNETEEKLWFSLKKNDLTNQACLQGH